MRRARRKLAALLTALMLIFPVYADEAVSSDAGAESTEAAAEDEASEGEASEGKALSAVLLLSSVSGALVVIALIYRGVDKAKYL